MKILAKAIYDNPEFGALFGSFFSFIMYSINIPETTAKLELIGAAIKDIGITAGSIVAVASLISYAQKNWLKKSNKDSDKK